MLFTLPEHPRFDVGRAMLHRHAVRLTRVKETHTLNVDQIDFLNVQNHRGSAAVDLSFDLVQILGPQLSAEPNPRSEPINLEGHGLTAPDFANLRSNPDAVGKALKGNRLHFPAVLIFQEILIYEDPLKGWERFVQTDCGSLNRNLLIPRRLIFE